MSKPHKHRDLIIAWANGSQIQVKESIGGEWLDCDLPFWKDYLAYRIRPREFKEGAWYPARHEHDQYSVVQYQDGFFVEGSLKWTERSFYWIGEELKIDWPED